MYNNTTVADPSAIRPAWAAEATDIGDGMSWTSAPLTPSGPETFLERVDVRGEDGKLTKGETLLSVRIGAERDLVDFYTVAEAKAAGEALVAAADAYEKAMYADSGRVVMDVRPCDMRKPERVYLVTQRDLKTSWSRVTTMRADRADSPCRNAQPGDMWREKGESGGFSYEFHGLFEMVAVLDESTYRFAQVK